MDFFEDSNVSLFLKGLKPIVQTKSKNYAKIQLYRHSELGRVLILDGELQHIEAWSPLYHETLIHLASAFVINVKRVLILGGGDFFAAHEVLKYSSVKEIVMIDHDATITDFMKKNYHHAAEVVKDSRFTLRINDAFQELKTLKGKFDLVINDSVDLVNHTGIKGVNIFKKLSQFNTPNGVCCDLIYRHLFEKRTTIKTLRRLKGGGLNTAFSLITVPEYPGMLHLMCIWGASTRINQELTSPLNRIQKNWIREQSKPCELYDPRFLKYYLYLPSYLKRITNEIGNF